MSVKKTSILQPGLVLPLELVLRRHMRDLEQIMRHIEHMTQVRTAFNNVIFSISKIAIFLRRPVGFDRVAVMSPVPQN